MTSVLKSVSSACARCAPGRPLKSTSKNFEKSGRGQDRIIELFQSDLVTPERFKAQVFHKRFGEMLPEGAWSAGLAAADDCDVFLSPLGTSGVVYPAAELPLRA